MDGPGPVIPSSDDRARSWLILAAGLVITTGLVFGLIALWPDGSEPPERAAGSGDIGPSDGTSTTTAREGTGEPSGQSTASTAAPPARAADLFGGDLPGAYADLLAAAGNPTQVIELAVYDTYALLAYRDPANPGDIDRRIWRDGEVGDAEPNPIDDRVDPDTEPSLFSPGELDPALLARLIADAPAHYELPTQITHLLVDRFLPFDERVLVRVYATPTDGRSGGGYVSYDTAGVLVKVCC